MLTHAGELARNVLFAANTALEMAIEDPVLLAVQAARRMPADCRQIVADALGFASRGPRGAVALWLRGHDAAAREAITHLLAPGSPAVPRRWRGVLAEIGVLLSVPGADLFGSPRTRARAAMRAGHIDEAVALAQGTPLAARYASERAGMRVGTRLPTQSTPARLSCTATPRALHVLTNSLPHTQSGYAVRSHQVLLAQQGAGVEVAAATRVGYPIVVGRLGARDREVVDAVPYSRLIPWVSARTPGARLAQQLRLLRPLAYDLDPTVIHATTNYPNALIAQALATELGRPWVYEVRGLLEDTWVASFPVEQRAAARASQRHRMLREREAELAGAADAVVTLSQTVAADLISRGVARERITVVPNGVPGHLLEVSMEPPAARERLGLGTGGFWVGTVSSLVGYEGLDTLLRAVALVRSRGVDVRCAIVGDGVARPELETLRTELGLGEAVVMPGRVAPSEAEAWYLALDAFVVPRQDTAVTRAVTPLKHMTAMALGRPVIASDLPALNESLAGAGLLVKPERDEDLADAVAGLADAPVMRQALATAGREVASSRTWEAIGRCYRELYEGLR